MLGSRFTMSESQRVVTTVRDHVAEVRLQRPDKRNGLDLPMFEAIIAAGEAVARDKTVRAVVLSGEGKSFCAGLDWASFLSMGDAAAPALLARDEARSPANVAQRVGWIWAECPVPVIAAVQGAAYGGGLQLALGADIRLVAPDAQLSVMEIRYGLVPDMGASKTLLAVVRPDVAKELTFTGRVVGAEEAVRLGLATRVDADPRAAALELAKAIAAQSPEAIRASKRLFDAAPALSTQGAFRLETELQLGLMGKPNQLEAVSSVMTKRTPTFSDPA
jgi:enoyl-CoA hydratase/carnithine racemase